MKDTFNREIDYFRISVTDRCNFRCRYCMPPEGLRPLGRDQILSYEEILKVASTALELGINKFRVTGGEPLVRKGVVDFLKQLLALPGVKKVSLTTNGYLLREYAEALSKLNLGSINIGLNTLQESRFNQISGGLKNNRIIWEGIKELALRGFDRIKINTVLLKDVNESEVIDFARLTVDYPITIRFIEFMPCGKWSENMAQIIKGPEIIPVIERELGKLTPEPTIKGDGPARYFKLKNARGELGFILPVSDPFCDRCNRLRLTPDGLVKSCLLSTERVDLKPILRKSGDQKELREAIKNAVLNKPHAHPGCRDIQMSKIGG